MRGGHIHNEVWECQVLGWINRGVVGGRGGHDRGHDRGRGRRCGRLWSWCRGRCGISM